MFGSSSFSASSFSQSPLGPTVAVTGVSAKATVPLGVEEHGGSITEIAFAEAPIASEKSEPFFITVTTEGAVVVAGLEATGVVNAVVFNASINLTGLEATSAVGSAEATVPKEAVVTGLSATALVGGNNAEFGGSLFGGLTFAEEPFASLADDIPSTIDVITGASASPTGLEVTGGVGSVTINAKATVVVTGLEATASVNGVTVVGEGSVAVTGVAGTGSPGSVTITEGAGIEVAVTSPRLVSNVGVATATGEISVLVSGVEATGGVGQIGQLSWNSITPDQNANWVEIAA